MKIKLIILFFLLMFPFLNVNAEQKINAHLFYQNGCPHCEEEILFFNEYLADNEDVKLYTYEVKDNRTNFQKFVNAQKTLNKHASGVPALFIGNQLVAGFDKSSTTGKNIITIINYYRNNPYRDLVGETLGIVPVNDAIILPNIDLLKNKINIPIFGEVDPVLVSLPFLAVVIGFVDGFNPCAMWILIFLISLLFGMKDRKKMWILGLTFLGISALTYMLFMLSWLNVAKIINEVMYIKIIIALIAIIFGTINIKKFFKKTEPGCEVVDDGKRKKIMIFAKKIVTEKKFIMSLIGIMILAVLVNVVELVCSLGLPATFTQILAMNNLNSVQYFTYVLIYVLFFLLDDILIFFIAMKTLKPTGISNRYTKYSHLIGGIIMLLIGILMIIKPEWLMFNF